LGYLPAAHGCLTVFILVCDRCGRPLKIGNGSHWLTRGIADHVALTHGWKVTGTPTGTLHMCPQCQEKEEQ